MKIRWTKQADKGLSETIDYLERKWTKREILQLEGNIQNFIDRIKLYPSIYPKTAKYPQLRKGMVDENNYIVYQVSLRKKEITIVNFRAAKQKPIY